MEEKKMDMKYYIGILCAVALVVGAFAGVTANAQENADIEEITSTVSIEDVVEHMEARGFDVTVNGDVVNAYREGYGKTISMTIDCPDGQCQKPIAPKGMKHEGMNPDAAVMKKQSFRFRMNGNVDMDAVRARMAEMGYDTEAINAKIANMNRLGEDCPMIQAGV